MGASGGNMIDARNARFRNLTDGGPLDALIVGGGITGAPLYHTLCGRGYRVALIDKGDFASGTSQASGMLIWGGLLYLKNLEFATVVKLCRARSEWLERFSRDGRTAPAEASTTGDETSLDDDDDGDDDFSGIEVIYCR